MRMLILKELRAALPIVVVSLLIYGWMVLVDLSFVTSEEYSSIGVDLELTLLACRSRYEFLYVTLSMATALGLMSALADNRRGTWHFVLFRPISRRAYVGTKLAVGVLVTMATSAVPVVILMAYAATPGFRAVPFLWQAYLPMWQICGVGAAVFCGAFLTGVRTASWWSKLWPLLGVGLLAWSFHESQVLMNLTSTSFAYWIICGCIVGGTAALAVRVTEERDFT